MLLIYCFSGLCDLHIGPAGLFLHICPLLLLASYHYIRYHINCSIGGVLLSCCCWPQGASRLFRLYTTLHPSRSLQIISTFHSFFATAMVWSKRLAHPPKKCWTYTINPYIFSSTFSSRSLPRLLNPWLFYVPPAFKFRRGQDTVYWKK